MVFNREASYFIKYRGHDNDYKSNNKEKLGNRKIAGEINEKSLIEEIYPLFILEQALNVAQKHFVHEEDVLLLTINPAVVKQK